MWRVSWRPRRRRCRRIRHGSGWCWRHTGRRRTPGPRGGDRPPSAGVPAWWPADWLRSSPSVVWRSPRSPARFRTPFTRPGPGPVRWPPARRGQPRRSPPRPPPLSPPRPPDPCPRRPPDPRRGKRPARLLPRPVRGPRPPGSQRPNPRALPGLRQGRWTRRGHGRCRTGHVGEGGRWKGGRGPLLRSDPGPGRHYEAPGPCAADGGRSPPLTVQGPTGPQPHTERTPLTRLTTVPSTRNQPKQR